MKSYLPIIVAVLVVLAALAASFVTARQLQPASARLTAEIDKDVAEASAMLAAYSPLDEVAARSIQIPGTQPAEPVDPAYIEQLESRKSLIAQALEKISAAVNKRDDSGEQPVSGESHAAATRLETILIIAQADLFRREAAWHRREADTARTLLTDLMSHWKSVRTAETSLARDLRADVPDAAGLQPETQPAAHAAPHPAAPQAKKPAAPQARKPSRGGAISKLFQSLGGGRSTGPQIPQEPPAQPQPAPRLEEAPAVAEAEPTQPVAPAAIVFEKLPTIAERIAQLKKQREAVIAETKQAEPQIQKLTDEVKTLSERLAEAQAKASEARRELMAMEEKGIDAADPQSLPEFTKRYEGLAKIFRESDREASILEFGGIRNARPATDDEEQVLAAPLAPAQPGAEMVPQRGLLALKQDLATLTGLAETRQQVIKQIDEQIARLEAQQTDVQKRVEKLTASELELAKRAAEALRRAIAECIQADKLEREALELLESRGLQAAQQAARAAGDMVRDSQSFYQQHAPEAVPGMAFLSGHARTLEGDVQFEIAMIQAQRARDITRHQRSLVAARRMGADPATLLPEGVTAEAAPAWTIQADAASKTAEEARAAAEKAGEAALDVYTAADNDLNRLWVLHTNIGAVHHFLSLVTTDPAKAQDHRDKARKQYEISIQDRRDRREAEEYRRIIEGLSQAAAQ